MSGNDDVEQFRADIRDALEKDQRIFLDQLKEAGVPVSNAVFSASINDTAVSTTMAQTGSPRADALAQTLREIVTACERHLATLPTDEDGQVVRAHEAEADFVSLLMAHVAKAPL